MNEIRYFNFPVSFLRKRSVSMVLEDAVLFCIYERTTKNKGSEKDFSTLIEKFGLNQIDFDNDLFETAKELYDNNKGTIRCGINKDVLMKHINTPVDDLNIEFRAYCASKALIGNKMYKKTRYKELFSLMFGYVKYEDMSEKSKDALSNIDNRRSMKKIINSLELDWHLSIYSLKSRGLYISYKLSQVDLIFEVKKKEFLFDKSQIINEKKAKERLSEFIDKIENCNS